VLLEVKEGYVKCPRLGTYITVKACFTCRFRGMEKETEGTISCEYEDARKRPASGGA